MIRATTEATALFHCARTLGLGIGRTSKAETDEISSTDKSEHNTFDDFIFDDKFYDYSLAVNFIAIPPSSKRSSNIDQFSSSCVYVDDGSSLLPLALPTIDIIRGGRSFELVKFVYFEWISL